MTELLVTVAIAAIVLAVGIPSYSDFMLNQEVRLGVQDLQTSLLFARSEAVKRASDVQVAPNGDDWKDGWSVRLLDGTRLRARSALNSQLASTAAVTITYGSDGHIPPPVPSVITFRVTGNSRVAPRCVRLDPGGRSSVLTDDGTINVCN